MPVTRRNFLKLSGATAAGSFFGGMSFLTGCKKVPDKLKGSKESTTICPYCGVGCGLIVSAKGGMDDDFGDCYQLSVKYQYTKALSFSIYYEIKYQSSIDLFFPFHQLNNRIKFAVIMYSNLNRI